MGSTWDVCCPMSQKGTISTTSTKEHRENYRNSKRGGGLLPALVRDGATAAGDPIPMEAATLELAVFGAWVQGSSCCLFSGLCLYWSVICRAGDWVGGAGRFNTGRACAPRGLTKRCTGGLGEVSRVPILVSTYHISQCATDLVWSKC